MARFLLRAAGVLGGGLLLALSLTASPASAASAVRTPSPTGAGSNVGTDTTRAHPSGGAWPVGAGWVEVTIGFGSDTYELPVTTTETTLLTVTDILCRGDSYAVRDHGRLIGITPSVPVGPCPGPDEAYGPDAAIHDATYSHATFTLPAGRHDLVLGWHNRPFAGASFDFRIDSPRLATAMTWRQETSGSNHGFGFAAIEVKPDQVCFGLRWSNLPTPTMAHIHRGLRGVAGPIVVPLFMSGPGPHSSGNGAWGCVPADPMIATEIVVQPSQFYVNVHTAQFPAGAIRGQLARALA